MFLGWGQCGGNEKWAWDRCRAILALHFQGWTHLKTSDSRGSASNFVFFSCSVQFSSCREGKWTGRMPEESRTATGRKTTCSLPSAYCTILHNFFFLLFIY